MLIGRGDGCTKSIPRAAGSERTNMRPWAWRAGVSASHTSNVCFTFFPSAISSFAEGKAERSSIGPICADTFDTASNDAAIRSSRLRNRGRERCGMPVIVHEFDAACKIEARDEHALAAGQAGCGSQAEAAADDAVHGARVAERTHAVLLELVDRALVVTQCREDPLLALEQERDVGAQRLAAAAFAHARDAEHDAQTP